MIDRAAMLAAARFVLALSCLLVAGCACVDRTQTTEPVPAAPPAAPIAAAETPAEIVREAVAAPAVAEAPDAQPTQGPSPSAIEPARSVQPAPAPRAAAPKVAAPAAPATPAVAPRQQPKPAVVVPAEPAPAPQVAPKVATAPAAPLDLNLLETRLRETKAIGVFTKLSLKNQVDDLLARFRAYHKRQGTLTLVELRRNYDMLMLKVLALLQDSDPSLARDIVRSRAAIWSILADPRKFTDSKLMAGATP
jgi:cell wall-associated NlpC family hydrolase